MTVHTTLKTHFGKSPAELLSVTDALQPHAAPSLFLRIPSSEAFSAGTRPISERRFRQVRPRANGLRSRAVGIVLPRSDHETGQLCDGINSVLSAAGFVGTVLPRIDGALCGTALSGMDALDGVLLPGMARCVEGIPSVSFADPAAPLEAADISVDRESLLRSALQHLKAHGHRRVALLFASDSDFASEAGRQRIHIVSRQAGLQDLRSVHLQDSRQPWITHDHGTVRDLLARDGVTAFVCCNSQVAEYTISVARGMGLHCPADFSVISCAGRNKRNRAEAATTVQLPWRTIGSIAAHQLLAKLRKPLAASGGVILVQPSVVQGWSTAALA